MTAAATGQEILKVIFSLSLSGSLLIVVLLICRPLLKKHFTRQWLYYIWLVVIARLLLPFAPANSLMGMLFRPAQSVSSPLFSQIPVSFPANGEILPATTAQLDSQTTFSLLFSHLWLLWLGVALLLMIRKITIYQSFVSYVRAGQTPVNDLTMLNQLAEIGAELGIKRPLELAVNPLLTAPMLIGLKKPCIVLPKAELTPTDFKYTIQHELNHLRRHDLLYKWLVQLTVCLHWFNPLVWLLGRLVEHDCELACDEAVIHSLDSAGRQAYGDTLLRALEYGGNYQNTAAALQLHESSQLMKERLKAIMRFKKKSKMTTLFSLLLAALFVIGAATAGAYTIPSAKPLINKIHKLTKYTNQQFTPETNQELNKQLAALYYEQNNHASLSMLFDELDRDTQKLYLDKAYADHNIAMFADCFDMIAADSETIEQFANQTYADNNPAFFSVIAHAMNNEQLVFWLERATADNKFNLRLMLLNEAGRDDEWEALWTEQLQKQLAEYAQLGISKTGGKYYYQGQPIRIFMDVYANDKSFASMQTNPHGEVDIKISRDDDGKIISLDYLTESEVQEMFGDWEEEEWDEDEDWFDEPEKFYNKKD